MPFHTPEEQARNQQVQQPQQRQEPQQGDLGASLTQPQPVGASPSFAQATNEFFADPVNRAGLLSFGLNLMQGGFGTPLQQFAQAAGAGVESAAGAEKFQTEQRRLDEAQEFRERELAQRGELAAQRQQTALDVARINAQSRVQAAGLSGTSLGNKIISQAGSEFTAVSTALRKNRLINKFSEEEILQKAGQAAQNKIDTLMGIAGREGVSLPGRGGAAGQTRQISPGAAGQGGTPGAVPAPGQTSPNFLGAPQAAAGQQQPQRQDLISGEEFRNSIAQSTTLTPEQKERRLAKFDELASHPQGRQQLLQQGIDVKPFRQGLQGRSLPGPAGTGVQALSGILEGIRRFRGE